MDTSPQVARGFMRSKGQLTLPQPIREATNLEEGDPVEFQVVDGGILVRPQKAIDASQTWFWTDAWQAGEAAASADIGAGRVTHFSTDEDFLASLDD